MCYNARLDQNTYFEIYMDKSNKGKALLPEEKKHVVLLRNYFERNLNEFGTGDSSSQRVADALEIGLATVNRIMADYNKDPDSVNKDAPYKGRPAHAIDASSQEIVRSYIREANLAGRYVTLEMIKAYLQEQSSNHFHISTLGRTLDRWGFEFGKGTRTQHLKEKDYVIAARQRYLRKMRNNRLDLPGSTVKPEVYLDESYINKNHSNDYIWYSTEDGPWVQKPTGKGERLIIMNAITKNGWVPNAKTVFKSARKTGDYHGQMNWEIFKKWFTEKLLPNIPGASLIIMDNASYHNVFAENSAPTAASSKETIRTWLENNKISFSADCLKAELIDMLLKIVPAPTYAIDEIAKQHGHEVVRTPPYHPELQPIEICWGVLKNEVARHCDFTMKNLLTQLELAFKKITAHTCIEIIKKIKKSEDKFWADSAILE
jgi:transposase